MHLLCIDFFIGKKKPRGLRNRLTTTPRLRTIQREKKIECWRLFWYLLFCTALQPLPCRSVLSTSHELNPALKGEAHENLNNLTKLEVLCLNRNLYWFLNFSDEKVIFHVVKVKTYWWNNIYWNFFKILSGPLCSLLVHWLNSWFLLVHFPVDFGLREPPMLL
jgi:hypothetical protein